jgi:hypothetical protein
MRLLMSLLVLTGMGWLFLVGTKVWTDFFMVNLEEIG